MNVQRCPECGQRLNTNYCDICMRKVPFGGVKMGKRQDPWDSRDGSSAHRMEKGHECVSFGKDRKVTWAGSSAHRMEKDHECISFGKEGKKTFSKPAKKQTAAGGKKAASLVAVIFGLLSLLPSLFGIFEDITMSGSEVAPEPEASIQEVVPAIAPREIYREGGITVIVDGSDLYYDDYAVYMTVINDTEEAVIVGTDLLSVNGIMHQAGYYASVAAGETVQEILQLYTWELEQDGITEIAEISFFLNLYREEDYSDIARSELITLETDIADAYEPPQPPNGRDLYTGDDVLLRLTGMDDYSGECALYLYLENLSENTVSVSAANAYVNGDHVEDTYFWEILRQDTCSLTCVNLYYEDTVVEEVTLELLIEHLDGQEVTDSRIETITFEP